MPKKLTQEEFVERATKVHNGKYDYSKVVYVNNYTKVCIVCPIHGEFSQTPMNHLAGGGYESIEEAKSTYKDARETYIQRVAEMWKEKLSTNVYNALINYEFSFED